MTWAVLFAYIYIVFVKPAATSKECFVAHKFMYKNALTALYSRYRGDGARGFCVILDGKANKSLLCAQWASRSKCMLSSNIAAVAERSSA